MTLPALIEHSLLRAEQQGLPRLEAQMLLLHVLGRRPQDRAWLHAHGRDALEPEQLTAFEQLCARRSTGEPIAYIVGRKEFYGLPLQITNAVLDPRDDTETLVDWALDLIAPTPPAERATPQVLDLGTGSGAIALAIQAERLHSKVFAVDACAAALQVAEANAKRLMLPIYFAHGLWFAPVSGMRFDVIVSNPPYIAPDDEHLSALTHEPQQALVAGDAGLADLAHIIAHAPAYLHAGGWLLLEHGFAQAEEVARRLQDAGFSQVQHRKDLAGHTRCTGGQYIPVD